MPWTAEIGFWRSVQPHQCWESWSVQSATDLYFRSFTDDSPENEANLDLNPRLNKPFLFINSEGGVVRKVVVPLHHKHAVGLEEIFFSGKHFLSFCVFICMIVLSCENPKPNPKYFPRQRSRHNLETGHTGGPCWYKRLKSFNICTIFLLISGFQLQLAE